MSFPSIGQTFIVHLKIISKLKADVKVVSASADTILAAINKKSNTILMRVIRLTNGSIPGVITCVVI